MNLNVLSIISLAAVIVLGGITSYTDIKYRKAYNLHLSVFLMVGIGVQCVSVVLNETSWKTVAINISLAFITAVLFYGLKIWAAGDAKLYFTMVSLISFPLYMADNYVIFPAFYVLEFVFTLAFFFVTLESIIMLCAECKSGDMPSISELFPRPTLESFSAWLVAFLFVDTCDVLLLRYGNLFLTRNQYLLIIVNILIAIIVLTAVKSWKKQGALSMLCIAARFYLAIKFGIIFTSLSGWTIGVIAITLFLRKLTSRYNYRVIPVSKLEAGNILAQCSLILMLPSAVKGLPKYADETTRCRLTEEEVQAIKRWERSKYGQDTVTIVRTVPFAPFIFVGTLLYFAFRFYLEGIL